VGLCLETGATVLGTVGKQMLRFSKLLELEEREILGRMVLIAGLVTNIVLGPAVDGLAYSFAPQSILAPLLGMDIVWNCMLAPFTLKEKLTRGRLLGCIILSAGMAGTALAGPQEDSEHSLAYLKHLLVRPEALAYYLVEALLILVGTMCIKLRPAGDHMRGFAMGILGGIIGGNLFFLKATSELVTTSISNGSYEVWLEPLPFFLAFATLACAAVSAALLTNGMREHEALSMVATYEGSIALSGCASGSIVMAEMDGQAPERVMAYVASLALILLGLCVTQLGSAPEKNGSKCSNGSNCSCQKAEPLLKSDLAHL